MERDFMGLNTNNPAVVKEEVAEGRCEGFARICEHLWLFPSNMASAIPQYMAMKYEMNEKPGKNLNCLGRIPVDAASTEQWNNSKPLCSSPQLTIFYDGTVTVFNDITPEMAQAIIFLAGKRVVPRQKVSACDPGHQSPISVSSRLKNVGEHGCSTNDELVKVAPAPLSPSPKMMASASAMISAAVPQARKASLARFLEKRKERVMNAAPYKKSGYIGSSVVSGADSSNVSGKDIATDA